MRVIVVMAVDTERRSALRSEDAGVFGVLRNVLGLARTADVAVQAYHAIALRHHDVKVVRHEQNSEVMLVAQSAD